MKNHAYATAFAARLRLLREERRLTQTELADEAGMGRAMIQYLEYAAKSPTLETLVALSRALGISVVELITIPGLTDVVPPQDAAPGSHLGTP